MGDTLTIARAINAALHDAMTEDPQVLMMGEDVGRLGGVFRVTDGLFDDFGADRVIDTPLAESGIIGTAIGLAMQGWRPVTEIQFDGFVFPAFDQITTQLAKYHARSQGRVRLPVTVRIPYGGGIGAVEHHSESPEAYFLHTAGLRVLTMANAHDAYGLTRAAIACDDPVILLEPKRRYWQSGPVTRGAVAANPWHAVTVRPGVDLTIACYGPMVHTALQAAGIAADEDGIDVEVVDLRSLSPLDVDAVTASVRRTGRLIVVHEAPTFGGLGAELAAAVGHACFYELEAPVLRVGAPHAPYPPARIEEHYLPDVDRVLTAIDEVRGY